VHPFSNERATVNKSKSLVKHKPAVSIAMPAVRDNKDLFTVYVWIGQWMQNR